MKKVMMTFGVIVLALTMTLITPAVNKNVYTVKAATSKASKVKRVTGLKKSKAIDGTYFYSKKKQYDGFYRKISWKKVKGAKGYEVSRYNYFSKKWEKIKTTKKTSIKITDMCDGEKVKLKVRAYKKKNGKKVYGRYSKVLSYTEKQRLYYCLNDKVIRKNSYVSGKGGYHISCDQQAFMLQNEYRKKAGANNLEWSDVLYEICKERAKDIVADFSHDKHESTSQEVLKNQYGYTEWMLRGEIDGKGYGLNIVGGENIYSGGFSPKESVKAWSKSSGHYRNMINADYHYGAIASYEGRWVAIFSMVDVDEIVINNNLESLDPALLILASE